MANPDPQELRCRYEEGESLLDLSEPGLTPKRVRKLIVEAGGTIRSTTDTQKGKPRPSPMREPKTERPTSVHHVLPSGAAQRGHRRRGYRYNMK